MPPAEQGIVILIIKLEKKKKAEAEFQENLAKIEKVLLNQPLY